MKNKSNQKIQVLGLTGSFGSGKTTCARKFEQLGACLIDADKIYLQLIKPGKPLYKKIASAFGKEIIGKKKQTMIGIIG